MIRKSIDVSVGTESGRPIAMLVQVASKYQSKINICPGNQNSQRKKYHGNDDIRPGIGTAVGDRH